MDWSVSIDAIGEGAIDDDALAELGYRLRHHAACASSRVLRSGHRTWGARIAIDADDAVEAVRIAHGLVVAAATAAGLPAWPVLDVEATRWDEFERRDDRDW